MLTLTLLLFTAPARAGEMQTITDGFCTPLIETQHCLRERTKLDVSVIDEDKAADLFRAFKSDPTYAWGYRPDGCYARATKMAREGEKQGVTFAKVYAEGRLRVLPPGPLRPEEQRWQWHVAPVAYVKSFKDGKASVELKVFDPAIFNGPVSVADWKEQLRSADDLNRGLSNVKAVLAVSNAENKLSYLPKITAEMPKFLRPEVQQLYFGSRYQYFQRAQDPDDATEWREADLKNADQTLKRYRLFELKLAKQLMPTAPVSPVLNLGTKVSQ